LSFWKQFPEIQGDLERVQEVIEGEISGPGGIISRALGDLARRDSKLLRPGFTILSARIRNGGHPADERIIHLAAAIEMLHMASLIHDDIVDDAATRRGHEALHVTHGSRAAVLLGDYLFARCFTLVSEHARTADAKMLSPSVARLVSAAIAEVNDQDQLDLSPRRYLHRIVGKTAVLFALSFHVGAVESAVGAGHGNNDESSSDIVADPMAQALRRVGYNLGVGFQIIDDLLDIAGNPVVTGKPRGTDVRSGIITLPLIMALRRDDNRELAGLIRKVRAGRGRVDRVMEKIHLRIERGGAVRDTRAVAERYTRRAHRELLRLPNGRDREILMQVTDKLLQRTA
jgi:heptaprenyl diphosphate synthase